MATFSTPQTTSVGSTEAVLVNATADNDYALWLDYSAMVSGDEFLLKVEITLSSTIKKLYYNRKITYSTIKKGAEPLRYLPATSCKGIKVTLQKTKDGANSTITATSIIHQLITYQ